MQPLSDNTDWDAVARRIREDDTDDKRDGIAPIRGLIHGLAIVAGFWAFGITCIWLAFR